MDKQKIFNIEEYHRGEWIPLMIKVDGKKIQKTAVITEDQAARLNAYSRNYKLKYVCPEKTEKERLSEVDVSKLNKKELQDHYADLFLKRPFHGWTEAEIIEKINNNK